MGSAAFLNLEVTCAHQSCRTLVLQDKSNNELKKYIQIYTNKIKIIILIGKCEGSEAPAAMVSCRQKKSLQFMHAPEKEGEIKSRYIENCR